ncbi:uncharacterized protein [Dysidea avara]|uniref:uncharacterized protein isoform X2 n=1 Tax=Dysidea avara TaxID=196820 RepID=UPI0033223EFC
MAQQNERSRDTEFHTCTDLPAFCKEGSGQQVKAAITKWEYKGTYTLATVDNPDSKKNGMIQICQSDGKYSLNLHGTGDGKQSLFRVYTALVESTQVTCMESVCFPGVYIIWDADTQSIEFYDGNSNSPPNNKRCVCWNQESSSGDSPNSELLLQAWTTGDTGYYLSFGGQDLPDGNTVSSDEDYIAELTTSKAYSSRLVFTEYQRLLERTNDSTEYVKNLGRMSSDLLQLHKHQKELKSVVVSSQNVDWKLSGTYMLSAVGNPDGKKNGMIQIYQDGRNYSLDINGTANGKQSRFRLYTAVVNYIHQVTCLESVYFPGIYISWNTTSQSIGSFTWKPNNPPNERSIGWSQVSPETPTKGFPNSTVLRAWTASSQESTGYYLYFGGQDQTDGNTAEDYTAELTTDQANCGALVLTNCSEYEAFLSWISDKVKYIMNLPSKLSTDLKKLHHLKNELEQVENDYKHHRKKLAHCLPPDSMQQTIAIPKGVQEVDILQQTTEVQCQWIMEKLKERQTQCDDLIERLTSFNQQYKYGQTFIEWGEQLFIESDTLEPAIQLEKCSEIRRKRDEEQERHTKVLEEGRKIIELNYVDLDKDHTDRLDQITKRWSTLWEKCDQWHLVVTTKLNLKLVDVKSSSKDKEDLWQPLVWEDDGIYTLATVGYPVDKTKGMIKIIQSGGNYYLNLQGNKDETQSQFRLYRALVNGHCTVKCLRSVCYPDIYISWDAKSKSIGFFKWTEDNPPKDNRYITWSLVGPETPNKDYPYSSVLQAWTTFPPDSTGYYLSFGSQDLPDGNTTNSDEDYIAELTTDKAESSLLVMQKCTGCIPDDETNGDT